MTIVLLNVLISCKNLERPGKIVGYPESNDGGDDAYRLSDTCLAACSDMQWLVGEGKCSYFVKMYDSRSVAYNIPWGFMYQFV